jgi:YaaC-like Protein
MQDAHWEALSMFESRDYIESSYRRRHGRQLNARDANAVATCFIQGREYFEAAIQSATSVRPLLIYYGVLSMSRGLILLRDSSKKEESLKPSHGIEAVDWGGTLAGGLDKILDVRIRATKGTFGELVGAAGNTQATGWWNRPGFVVGLYRATLPRPAFVDGVDCITLDDLLSRDHRFLAVYPQTTGRKSRVHLGEVVADPSRGIDVSVYSSFATEMEFRKQFGQPASRAIVSRVNGDRLPIPNTHFLVPGADLNALKTELPLTQFIGNDGMFVVEDLPNGDRLSELLRTFLLSYILGMIVRYYPSRWIALLRNEKGDAAQPCLKAAARAITNDFPKLVIQTLS